LWLANFRKRVSSIIAADAFIFSMSKAPGQLLP
jgi:hypothetical protein